MRRFLLICFSIFAFDGLISQNLNFAEHEGLDRTGNMVSINSKDYYIGDYGNDCCGVTLYNKGKDKNGTILTRKTTYQFTLAKYSIEKHI